MPNQNEQQQTDSELKRNQAGQSQNDDPRTAPESGEPLDEGRQRGRVVDKKSRKAEDAPPGKPGDNKDWESGRQQAV